MYCFMVQLLTLKEWWWMGGRDRWMTEFKSCMAPFEVLWFLYGPFTAPSRPLTALFLVFITAPKIFWRPLLSKRAVATAPWQPCWRDVYPEANMLPDGGFFSWFKKKLLLTYFLLFLLVYLTIWIKFMFVKFTLANFWIWQQCAG